TAKIDIKANTPSPTAPKEPTKRASISLFNCLEDVREETSPWNTEIVRQAIVITNNGNQETSDVILVVGGVIVGIVNNNPRYKINKPTTNWCELIKALGCNNYQTGKVEAI